MAKTAIKAAIAVVSALASPTARPLASSLYDGWGESITFRQACCQEVPDWETVFSLNCTCDTSAAHVSDILTSVVFLYVVTQCTYRVSQNYPYM